MALAATFSFETEHNGPISVLVFSSACCVMDGGNPSYPSKNSEEQGVAATY